MKRAVRSDSLLDLKRLASRRDSYASASSSETLISNRTSTSSSTTSEAGDCDPDFYTDGVPGANDNVVHAIIIPNYKEEIDTLRETLDVLASHPQARYSYDVSRSNAQTEIIPLKWFLTRSTRFILEWNSERAPLRQRLSA